MILPLALFTQLALACAPSVHVETLAAIARTESGLNPLALHDNTTGRSFQPRTVAEAQARASALLRQGHSLDLGLLQVNSANLAHLGLTVADAFDPCRNLAGGARVLVDGYQPPQTGGDAQPHLLKALSRYNTGHPERGFQNGYVRKVQASAKQIVPAIRVAGVEPAERVAEIAADPSSPPPSWDVYGQAQWRRQQGGLAPGQRPGTPVRLPARVASPAREAAAFLDQNMGVRP